MGQVESLHVLLKGLIIVVTELELNFLDRELNIKTFVKTVDIKDLSIDSVRINGLIFVS